MRCVRSLLICACFPVFGFTPWYTGTYIANGGQNTPPGSKNFQTFTTATVVFGNFDNHGSLDSSAEATALVINTLWANWGMTKWLDFTFVGQFVYVDGSARGESLYFGPIQVYFGFMCLHENSQSWQPNVRLLLVEQFPTTPLDSLDAGKGFTSISNGSIQTGASFIISKQLYSQTAHPLNVNLNLDYYYQTSAHITGISTFGGDDTTNITTHPSSIYAANLAVQLSLNQNWVVCSDINYSYEGKTSLKGSLGRENPAMATPANQLITLTPGIQYNFSSNLGLLSSFWITPWGINSQGLFGAIFSVNGTF